MPATALFILIGAEPHTGWLPGTIRRDRWGFLVTGNDLLADGRPPAGWPPDRPPMLLETSLPGVFAAGDVRQGSTKRVAGAVGTGRSPSAWSTSTWATRVDADCARGAMGGAVTIPYR